MHVSKTQKRINISTLANSIWSIPNVLGSVSMDGFLSIRIGAASSFLIVRATRQKDIERETEIFFCFLEAGRQKQISVAIDI